MLQKKVAGSKILGIEIVGVQSHDWASAGKKMGKFLSSTLAWFTWL